jgi:Tol biopolymer transport system component
MSTTAIVLLSLATAIGSLGADEREFTDASAARDQAKRVRQLVDAIKRAVQDKVPDADERLELFLIDVLNSDVKSVAREPLPGHHHCGSPSWSDDGGRIIFDATPGRSWSKTHLLTVGLVDGRRKVTDLGPGNCPALSPDGNRIAFLLNGSAVPGAQPGIWVMDADGSDRRLLWRGSGAPKWSSDGGRLLIVGFSNPTRLTILDVKTAKPSSVQLAKQSIYSVPSWAGDGRTIVTVIEPVSS